MKVSLITVCYNAERYIDNAIQSVIDQSYEDIEYILVDGNSTDATLSIIKKYENRISKIISEPDKGIYDAMNKGVSHATGEVIGILNADDFYFDSNVIKDVVECFQSKETDTLYGDLVYVDPVDTKRVIRYWRSGEYNRSKFKYGWMLPHPTFFVKRHIYEKFGHFNLSLKTSADYEYMLRVLYKYRVSTQYLPRVMTIMRTGGTSNASITHRIRANSEDRKAWTVNDLKPGLFTRYLKPIRKLIQYTRKNKEVF